ncbi:MAG: AMP-binding protein, partial [Polyangiaceae bacterium]
MKPPPSPSLLPSMCSILDRDETVIRTADGTTTGRDLLTSARRGAARLNTPRPRVGIWVEPGADWIGTMLAVIYAGGVAIPLSPLYPDREIRWLLQDAEADTVVASGHMLTRARTLPPELTVMASEAFLAAGPERAA